MYVSYREQTTNGFVFRFPNVKNDSFGRFICLTFSCLKCEGDISVFNEA